MPTPTYTPLANITLSATTATVTFSSISQAYKDLVLVATGTGAGSAITVSVRFNGDAGASSYSVLRMSGNGTTAASSATASASSMELNGAPSYWDATTISSTVAHIFDYSATDKHKTVLARCSSPARATSANVGRWLNTAAITSIAVTDNFAAGTTLALYGVAA